MIGSSDVYHVVASTVPLYVAMILAYVSVKWWKVFTPEQCSGINKFVAKFSIPLLSFQVISSNNISQCFIGLFMASQSTIIACGTRMALVAMGMKFFAGPALMAACSFALGMRGTLLKVAIVQAALPQGIVSFVFAKEYNVNPDILSTGVIFGLLIALPVALVYYSLLSL